MRIEWIGAGSLMATAALAGGCAPVPSEDTTELGSSVQALSQTLYSEGFETGQPQLFYDAACTIDTAASASGTYGMACDDTASVTVPVSTAGATNLTLGYTVETTRYESSEQLIVETSLDSVEWEPLQTLSGVNSQTSYAFELGPQFEGGQLTVRFRSTANGWLEKFYLDDIYVTAEVTPDPCDGIDNDQDGQVDEDFVPEPTSCGIGACNRDGMTTCDDGVLGDSCVPGQPAASDALCDEVDEDCDGVVDEDADCSGCAGPYVAFAEDHVAAGRATSAREYCGWFCRETVYRAVGSNEVISSTDASKLFQSEPGVYTQESCGATQHPLVPADNRIDFEPGERFPNAGPGQWQWHQVDGTYCRNGDPTGLQLRYGTSDNLVIYFEGGGACYNPATCSSNPEAANPNPPGSSGIFDESNPENPVASWNAVFIPYCTGDVFFGSQPDGSVAGVSGSQQFVGYQNTRRMLERLIATFPDAEQVLVTGQSAGGFGSIANFHQAQQAFDGIGTVHPISDSGPPFGEDYVDPCLVEHFQDAWNIYAAAPAFGPGDSLGDMMSSFASWYPGNTGGIISSTRDLIIRQFWSYGQNDCTGTGLPSEYPGTLYEAGVLDMRDNYLGTSLGTYLIGGTDTLYDPVTGTTIQEREKHVWIRSSRFYETYAGNLTMAEWVADALSGTVRDLGP